MKAIFPLINILVFLCACNSPTNNIKADDQLPVSYVRKGNADTCLLFLHGWGINKTYWENQQEYFAPRYKTVTIDLPGFGKSGGGRSNYTIEGYARDVASVIKQMRLSNVILIMPINICSNRLLIWLCGSGW